MVVVGGGGWWWRSVVGRGSRRKGRVFFEETSLVARPGVSFRACKERLAARLAAMGVAIDEGGGRKKN